MSELRLQQCRLDNRYDLLDCISRGSYAELFIARDAAVAESDSHRLVVIKALNPQLQGEIDQALEQTLLENFRNEAVALDRVRHPQIINRLGHGTAIDLAGRTFHYIVLEYMAGGDLAALCRRQPLSLGHTLFYLEQVCAGLAYAHAQEVIHRDIKPHNLLLTADRRWVKIIDFGVAKIKLIAAAESAITRVGTDVYAAPEHHPLAHTGPLVTRPLVPLAHLTPAADVYSLAKTAYMLLTGEAPRRFAQRTITDFPSPFDNEPWAREVLNALMRATHVNPTQRTATVDEFWREISRARRFIPDWQFTTPDAGIPGASYDSSDASVRPVRAAEHAPPRRAEIVSPPSPIVKSHDGRPRIIVDISHQSAAARNDSIVLEAASSTQAEEASRHAIASAKPNSLSAQLKLWLVALVIMLGFAGMLYATYVYMRRPARGVRSSAATTTTTTGSATRSNDEIVGREFMTTTDVKLRRGPSVATRQVGLASNGSRVRVIAVRDAWYQVQIVEHARPPGDAAWLDQGWLNSRLLK